MNHTETTHTTEQVGTLVTTIVHFFFDFVFMFLNLFDKLTLALLRTFFGPVVDAPQFVILVAILQIVPFVITILYTICATRLFTRQGHLYWQELQKDTNVPTIEPMTDTKSVESVTPATSDQDCCRICLTNVNTHALIPCGHLILCAHCAIPLWIVCRY